MGVWGDGREAQAPKRKRPCVSKFVNGAPLHGRESFFFRLLETLRDTPSSVEFEETNCGFLVINHGKAAKPSGLGRDRRGAALVLSPEAQRAWESGGSKFSHGKDGRVLAVSIPLTGQTTRAVGGGYFPGSGAPSDERQVFYSYVAVRTNSVAGTTPAAGCPRTSARLFTAT